MRGCTRIVLLLLIGITSNCAAFTEHILHFNSDITIAANGALCVHETIMVALPAGRHGLIRDFPTNYKDRWNINHKVRFDVKEVVQDDHPVSYEVFNFANGKRIRIGDANSVLSEGIYTYDIIYSTNRQMGFFEDHDELYWNVNGNGWTLPMQKVAARVTIPADVPENSVSLEAYTGYKGAKDKNYTAKMVAPNQAYWETNRLLRPYEGLTIVLSLPKGYIKAPTFFTKVRDFIKDNLGLIVLLLGLIAVCFYYLYAYFCVRRSRSLRPIIPLFYPPENMGPAHCRYLIKYKYDERCFAAEIIEMAVHGLLRIESKKQFLKTVYTLKEISSSARENKYYQALSKILFSKSSNLVLDESSFHIVAQAQNHLKSNLSISINRYFEYHQGVFIKGFLIFLISVFGFLFLSFDQYAFLAGSFLLYNLSTTLLYYSIRGYTSDGQKLYEQIKGFELFLVTTETERLKIIGTPPTKNPELYEKYLPYAVALGVEKQWTAQFASVFANLARQGHPYMPLWYMGSFQNFRVSDFASKIGDSLVYSIASSDTRPGSSSGSGGGGSSGGGGGGGGGSSW